MAACLLLLAGCKHKPSGVPTASAVDYTTVATPSFNADSAYSYVAGQVAFGPRTPGSAAQRECAAYIVRQMQQWCDTVVVQDFPAVLWDGREVRGKNIIASIEARPGSTPGRRILLGAHWDSRLWADHDPLEANQRKPIDGANDGASGAAMLMELARGIASQRLAVAVDFIFFDVEDQGVPEWADQYEDNSWCKGSQYWSRNPHKLYYSAIYGILFDMVGTEAPRYTKEQISRQYASHILTKVWSAATAIGYGDIFVARDSDPILDDHYYVNSLAGIPMIDIVQNSPDCSFFPYWHTMEDNLGHIDRNALRATGEVVLKTLYGDYR